MIVKTTLAAIPILLSGAMLLSAVSIDTIVTEGIVNAPVDAVWKAFTTRQGLESWMVAKTEIDLKVGGLWRTSYSKESTLDDDAAIHHTILAYDPGKMFSFRTVKFPKSFPFPNVILKTWNVMYFEPVGEGQTKVTARMLGFTDEDESQRMRTFFEQGNRETMDSLIKRFERR
jgi:uncharacterized protein YndB with AHSA1/START domain